MTAAVSELETEYGDRANFVIVSPEDTQKATADIEKYGFTDNKHGLVVFDAAGEVVAKMPGHDYPKSDIEANLKLAL
ncbi:MAG: hypothetical protein ACI8QC_004369 [Planctomycetota bacterium]